MATALLSIPFSRIPHFGIYLSNFGHPEAIRSAFRAGLNHRRALVKVRIDAAIHHILRSLYKLSPDIAEFENTTKPRYHSPDFTYTISLDPTYRPWLVITGYDRIEYDGLFHAWLGRSPNSSRRPGYTPKDQLRRRPNSVEIPTIALPEQVSWEEFHRKKQAEREAGIYTAPKLRRRVTVDFSQARNEDWDRELSSDTEYAVKPF